MLLSLLFLPYWTKAVRTLQGQHGDDMRATWGRQWGDMGTTCGRHGDDNGVTWGWHGGNNGATWRRHGEQIWATLGDLEATWGRHWVGMEAIWRQKGGNKEATCRPQKDISFLVFLLQAWAPGKLFISQRSQFSKFYHTFSYRRTQDKGNDKY